MTPLRGSRLIRVLAGTAFRFAGVEGPREAVVTLVPVGDEDHPRGAVLVRPRGTTARRERTLSLENLVWYSQRGNQRGKTKEVEHPDYRMAYLDMVRAVEDCYDADRAGRILQLLHGAHLRRPGDESVDPAEVAAEAPEGTVCTCAVPSQESADCPAHGPIDVVLGAVCPQCGGTGGAGGTPSTESIACPTCDGTGRVGPEDEEAS